MVNQRRVEKKMDLGGGRSAGTDDGGGFGYHEGIDGTKAKGLDEKAGGKLGGRVGGERRRLVQGLAERAVVLRDGFGVGVQGLRGLESEEKSEDGDDGGALEAVHE